MNTLNDLHKNPMLYYVLVPLAAAVWPFLLYSQTLPQAQKELDKEKSYVVDVNNLVQQILTLDPMRLRDPNARATGGRTFDYATEVDRVAKVCGIGSYESRPEKVMDKNRKTQSASVSLNNVGLVKIALFISTLLGDWTDLECTKIELDLNKNEKDVWKVKLGFNYTF